MFANVSCPFKVIWPLDSIRNTFAWNGLHTQYGEAYLPCQGRSLGGCQLRLSISGRKHCPKIIIHVARWCVPKLVAYHPGRAYGGMYIRRTYSGPGICAWTYLRLWRSFRMQNAHSHTTPPCVTVFAADWQKCRLFYEFEEGIWGRDAVILWPQAEMFANFTRSWWQSLNPSSACILTALSRIFRKKLQESCRSEGCKSWCAASSRYMSFEWGKVISNSRSVYRVRRNRGRARDGRDGSFALVSLTSMLIIFLTPNIHTT